MSLVTFTYENYRGEISDRIVAPIKIEFGSTEFHQQPQWLLYGWDTEKKAVRTFAMKDIKNWNPYAHEVPIPQGPRHD